MKDVLRGRLVRLAEAQEGDADYFQQHQWAGAFARSSEWDLAKVRSHDFFVKMMANNEPDRMMLFVRKLSDDSPVGWVELDEIQLKNQVGELGIGIVDPAERGHGYGTDAINCMLAYAFFEMGLYKVRLGVNSNNAAAVHTYERVGFKREVVNREGLYQDGKWFDQYENGIMGSAWMADHQDWPEF